MSIKHLFPLTIVSLLACGGGGGGATIANGTLSLKLGSDSTSSYSKVYASLQKVEYKSSNTSTWSTLAEVETTYDLLALQNGNSATLASATSLKPGTYSFRLTWAGENYAYPSKYPGFLQRADNSTEYRMTLPTTTSVSGTVDVAEGSLTTAEILFSGNQIAQKHASLSVPYTFQATAQVLDLANCARILGQATSGSTPLEGAEVFAETVDGSGLATVQRRALTDSNGQFVMEGLPIGKIYYLASQPGTATLAYGAVSTSPITASSATDFSANLSFTSSMAPGSLDVSVTPISTSSQGTWVELRETLATATGVYKTLVVRSQTVDTETAKDTTSFTGLLPSTYGIMVQRSTSGGDASASTGSEELVETGATTTAVVAYTD